MRVCAWALLAGCSFAPRATPDGAESPALDAVSSPDAQVGACGGKVWSADFSTDPTALDGNGDGVPDWALRDGSTFPTSQLVSGVWSTPGASQPLDTQPKQLFTTRVVIHVRMRNTTTSGARGAVFWINVGYDAQNSFAPLFVDAKLQADQTQTVSVWTKTAAAMEMMLAQQPGLSSDFVDVDLDVDPTTLQVAYTAGGLTGNATLVRQPPGPATDQWATVVAYSGAAEFDSVRVEVCP